jgi:hypothetical protein
VAGVKPPANRRNVGAPRPELSEQSSLTQFNCDALLETKESNSVGFQVLVAVTVKNITSWDMEPCGLAEVNTRRLSGKTRCLRPHGTWLEHCYVMPQISLLDLAEGGRA